MEKCRKCFFEYKSMCLICTCIPKDSNKIEIEKAQEKYKIGVYKIIYNTDLKERIDE